MELKVRKIETFHVDAYNLTDFLSEKMGKTVEFVGSPNDTDYLAQAIALDPNSTMYEFDKEDQDTFVETGRIDLEYQSWNVSLGYAVEQGWIEPGEYVVTVSW